MYIGTGSFIIRGKRNFVIPRALQLGFTLMFTLNEDSLINHIGERKIRLDQSDIEKWKKKDKKNQLELSKSKGNHKLIVKKIKLIVSWMKKCKLFKLEKCQSQENNIMIMTLKVNFQK